MFTATVANARDGNSGGWKAGEQDVNEEKVMKQKGNESSRKWELGNVRGGVFLCWT